MIKKTLGEDKSLFESHELSLIAALIAWNFPIYGVNTTNPKKVTFFFIDTPELQKAIDSYWNNTGMVLPKGYFNALREAKSRIYAERR